MPFFSVVIAAFNSATWIVSTVRSALGQTYPDFEIIVIGDGCTDQTGDILKSNFGETIRWRNLDRNSGGQSFPNNEGIRLARGTHIAYLGHDDIWSPQHLEHLATLVRTDDPDFVVSGAVYHGPPGSRHYHTTGIFGDPRAAKEEFFPPSSFTHRRDVVQRIGFWRDPNELRAPADCEFLLRAVNGGCTFVSTKTITVHKFAAGHRYLSYRFPSDAEQRRILDRLSEPGGESRLLEEIRKDIADGADNSPIRYPDFNAYRTGVLFRKNRRAKGLDKPPAILVNQRHWLPIGPFWAGLDWYKVEEIFLLGAFRWSGPNPNPRYLVNVRVIGSVELQLHVLAFASEELAQSIKLEVNEREVAFVRDRRPDGSYILKMAPVAGPVDDGLVLQFHLPRCVPLLNEPRPRRAGLALRGVEVIPL